MILNRPVCPAGLVHSGKWSLTNTATRFMGNELTLGSLFDGIGGFPLAAVREGITPVWASELETAPVSITKRHFPDMRHVGDITKVNGANIEPVDIITFGSPCQDLSIAGYRAGLGGERSGLFMEAIRVIKEMRTATDRTYPARIVWENVPGVFSSGGGKDFQTVIEEIARIAVESVSIPRPPAKCGWLAAGAVMGDCWSIAWRVMDAQFWGVPQHRRRIFLVADFGTGRAAEILFKPEGVPGDHQARGAARDNPAGNTPKSIEQYTVDCGHSTTRIQMNPETSVTLRSGGGGWGAKTGLYCLPRILNENCENIPFVRKSFGLYRQEEIGKTLTACGDITSGDLIASVFGVRRLTPLECERLQGYPDGWTKYGHDNKLISDSQRYKARDNSVAVPCVRYILSGMKM
jgi:DNA (cytosine-5)-methyltransferase 1